MIIIVKMKTILALSGVVQPIDFQLFNLYFR